MSQFGSLLRSFRHRSVDPLTGSTLSQQRFAEFLWEETGIYYSVATISDWERGQGKISVDERSLLLSIISTIVKLGGIKTIEEANGLLEAGNYRGLSSDEDEQVFPENTSHKPTDASVVINEGFINFIQQKIFYSFLSEEQKSQFAQAEKGEGPSWPRELIVLINMLTQGSIFHSWQVFNWLWVFLVGFWLLAPSLRWPFKNQEQALIAIIMYVVGTICIPALIGLFTNTQDDLFWQQRPLVSKLMLRLYVHQGASIGFHLGYMAIFVVNLFIYSLDLRSNLLIELIEIVWLLIISYASARLVPYNLWKVYGRLTLADGEIFFIFMAFGPLWGLFFYTYSPILLDRMGGLISLLIASTLVAGGMAWQHKRTGMATIPAYWWASLPSLLLILYLLSIGYKDLLGMVFLINLLVTFIILLSVERIHFTLRGFIGLIAALGFLIILFEWNLWIGCAMVGIFLLLWWLSGRKYLSFPLSFWAILIVFSVLIVMQQQQWLFDLQASIIGSFVTILLLLWEYYKYRLIRNRAVIQQLKEKEAEIFQELQIKLSKKLEKRVR